VRGPGTIWRLSRPAADRRALPGGIGFSRKGRGAPKLKGSGKGDLLARLRVAVPTKLSKAEREAIENLKKVSHDDPREKVFS